MPVKQDINALKLEHQYQLITGSYCLGFVDNPAKTLNKLYEKLVPGGYLIIKETTVESEQEERDNK